MKYFNYVVSICFVLILVSSCGQSKEEKAEKEKARKDSIAYAIKLMDLLTKAEQKQNTPDTNKYFEFRIAKIWNGYSVGYIKFELKSLMHKTIDKFWIDVSLKSKSGDYLGSKESLQFDNVRSEGTSVVDQGFIDVNINNVSEAIFQPYTLQLEGQDYKFDLNNVRFLSNKYKIKLTY